MTSPDVTGPDISTAVSALLDRWADGIRRRDLDQIAAQFTEDALFQGFDPEPAFGRAAVVAYYGKQPPGLTVEHTVLHARELAPGVAVGYAAVTFHRPDQPVRVYLTVVAVEADGVWLLRHYHVSRRS
ncbi:SgcJ/EcaC family oxidoreductase [Promicromonospora thailandica]|uniref:SnoaL-like domain-containing protein n=1 Tax=Promicromonospora thailandica TaxID=765201 RepID=A0A9X2G5F0_9MICO|nr:SgcJ/EcaC family oxidoreductase [Promicromonospora thailandica]MCP2267119.1 hypothetical protein [Promicromonospora thailandica]BFF16589.1 SgcJ/EcaC family oxidoreductase [Promicromonospora thailandica]